MGLIVVESAEDVPFGSIAFIRARSYPVRAENLRKKCMKVVKSGTCPFVGNSSKKGKRPFFRGVCCGNIEVTGNIPKSGE